jgi:hypothetical protein
VYDLIFRQDPTISIADEIAEEDDTADVDDNIESSHTNKGTSAENWSDNWLILEDEADDTEG